MEAGRHGPRPGDPPSPSSLFSAITRSGIAQRREPTVKLNLRNVIRQAARERAFGVILNFARSGTPALYTRPDWIRL
jgi:hypothetical protein